MHYLMPPDDLASPSDGGAGPSAPPGTGGDALRWGGWASGFGGTGDVDGNDDAEGFSSDTGGVTGGLDYRPGRDCVVGLLVGGGWTDVNGDGLSGDAEIDSVTVGLYGGLRFGRLYVDGLAAYTHHDIDTSRDMLIAGVLRTAEGSHDGDEFDGNVEVGYRVAEGTFEAEPFFGLSYTNLAEESFDESGAGAMNLSVDDRTTNSLRSALGARFAWNIKSSDGVVRWVPRLHARWEHQYMDTENDTSASFSSLVGSPSFTVRGIDVDDDSAVVGAGLGARLSDSVRAFLGYEGRFGELETDHQGQGGIEIRW